MDNTLLKYAFAGWFIATLILLLMPTGQEPVLRITYIDKVAHFGMFFVLGALMMLVAPDRRSRVAWIAFGVFYAVITEVLQGVVPWERSANIYDVVANLAGLAAGASTVLLWLRRREQVAAG